MEGSEGGESSARDSGSDYRTRSRQPGPGKVKDTAAEAANFSYMQITLARTQVDGEERRQTRGCSAGSFQRERGISE